MSTETTETTETAARSQAREFIEILERLFLYPHCDDWDCRRRHFDKEQWESDRKRSYELLTENTFSAMTEEEHMLVVLCLAIVLSDDESDMPPAHSHSHWKPVPLDRFEWCEERWGKEFANEVYDNWGRSVLHNSVNHCLTDGHLYWFTETLKAKQTEWWGDDDDD